MKLFDRERPLAMVPIVLVAITIATSLSLWFLLVGRARMIIHAPTDAGAADYRAMLLWASSFVAYVVVAIWVTMVAFDTVRQNRQWINARLIYAFVSITVIVIALVRPISLVRGKPVPSLLSRLDVGVRIFNVTAIGNVIGALAISFLIAAVVTFLLVRNEGLAHFRRNLALSRLLFYSSALLLAVGVVQIYLLFSWPSQLQHGILDPDRKPMLELARTNAMMCGIVYSLVLLCLYVPLGVWHERRVMEFADDSLRSERSAFAVLADIFVLVGPALTALGIPKILAA